MGNQNEQITALDSIDSEGEEAYLRIKRKSIGTINADTMKEEVINIAQAMGITIRCIRVCTKLPEGKVLSFILDSNKMPLLKSH